MRKTSSNFNAFPDVRHVDFRISFGVVDESATSGDVSYNVNNPAYIGDISTAVDSSQTIAQNYATLEQDEWILDGSKSVMKDSVKNIDVGYWSNEISDSNGNFTHPIVLTYEFTHDISTLGWSFAYDSKSDEFCTDIGYQCYDEQGGLVGSGRLSQTASYQEHTIGIDGYRKVVFTFYSTNKPYRRLRLMEVVFGVFRYYDANTLQQVLLTYDVDPTCDRLPSRELSFDFDNSDKKYNLFDPDDVYQFLQEGQKIKVSAVVEGEVIDMGDFFFTSVTVNDIGIVPTVQGNDRIYVMDGKEYDNGRDVTVTLQSAVNEIIGSYGLTINYNGNQNTKVVLAIPEHTKVREALRMVIQAAMCTAWIDRDGVLQIKSLEFADEPCDFITKNQLYDFTGVSVNPVIGCEKLTVRNEFKNWTDDRGNEKLGKTETYVSGDEDSEYVDTTSNPCVAEENGQAVADWLLRMHKRRKEYNVWNRCNPAVEIGDTIKIDDIFENHDNAIVTSEEIEFIGTLSAHTGGVGE